MSKLRGKFTKSQIDGWIISSERFEMRSDGANLWLRYRSEDLYPRWVFRYSMNRKARSLSLGSYRDVSLSMARAEATRLRGLIALGHDVAQEKRNRAFEAAASESRSQRTVGKLADQFFDRYVSTRLKHPAIVRSWIDNKIKPALGRIPISHVSPSDVDEFIQTVAKDAPTVAPKILSRLKAIFNLGVKLGYISTSPAAAFESSDVGVPSVPRDRWLSSDELTVLFQAMQLATGWNVQNTLTVKLLLQLAVRKNELVQARVDEFDLDAALWRLPAKRTKSSSGIVIPLPRQAKEAIEKLLDLGRGSEWLLPARKLQTRLVGHISGDTINAALAKSVYPLMTTVEPFTVHDFRRTARTHLEDLGVDPLVSERCLNHRIRGLVGVYNKHDYLDKRKVALQLWADRLESLEEQGLAETKSRGLA